MRYEDAPSLSCLDLSPPFFFCSHNVLIRDPSSPPGVVSAYNSNWYDFGYYLFMSASGLATVQRDSHVLASKQLQTSIGESGNVTKTVLCPWS